MPAPPDAADAPQPDHCLNCAEPLHGPGAPRPRFCPACGQETNLKPPTVMEFLQQFGGAYLSTEGALWRTLKLLLLKPGALTAEYLAGRRRHYVLPLRLYLTVSVLVLLLLRSGASVQVNIPTPQEAEHAKANLKVQMFGGRAGIQNGVFFCHDLPAWACANLKARIDVSPTAVGEAVASFRERFIGRLGTAMFLLLPSFALWLRLVYARRGLAYTEHLVMALHLHAFWFVMLGLMVSGWELLQLVAMLAVPSYGLLALRRVYGGRWWATVLRAILLALLHLVGLSITLAVVAMVALVV